MTDVIVLDKEGRSFVGKAATTSHDECIGCMEALYEARGCPPDFAPDFEFLPALDTCYRQWLGRPLPDEVEFTDKTLERIREWDCQEHFLARRWELCRSACALPSWPDAGAAPRPLF